MKIALHSICFGLALLTAGIASAHSRSGEGSHAGLPVLVVRPRWNEIPLHPASMASLCGFAAILALGVFAVRRSLRLQSSE